MERATKPQEVSAGPWKTHRKTPIRGDDLWVAPAHWSDEGSPHWLAVSAKQPAGYNARSAGVVSSRGSPIGGMRGCRRADEGCQDSGDSADCAKQARPRKVQGQPAFHPLSPSHLHQARLVSLDEWRGTGARAWGIIVGAPTTRKASSQGTRLSTAKRIGAR